jgi:4,5-dihydroxyphthalate decarboxylase
VRRLSLAVAGYERVRALVSGDVRPDGLELQVTTLPAAEVIARMAGRAEFDAGELSLSDALLGSVTGYVLLPIFTYRAFRQSMLWVRTTSGATSLEGIRGARVGIASYTTTALLYLRGLLSDEHAIAPSEIRWVRTGAERHAIRPSGAVIEDVRANLDGLLEAGEVDAIATFQAPIASGASPWARRLIVGVREAEADYYRRTRIFPIMHVIGLRRAIHEEDPGVAARLYEAFERSKAVAYDDVKRTGYAAHTLTPWSRFEVEETQAIFGEDPYPSGIEPNRPSLEAAARYATEQFEVDLPTDVADLFSRI